jgi:oligopeptide transport system ATP-binding protein
MNDALLAVTGLKKYFPLKKGLLGKTCGHVKAVDGVGFTVAKGETLGIVGESGCGKSTTARVILRLLEPTAGRALLGGTDIFAVDARELRQLRRRMQIVFQDPFASLDPRMTVADIIAEPIRVHGLASGAERRELIRGLLQTVGLADAHLGRHPHEFSGGQRQRIGIARALSLRPELLFLDEPVSALDVSIQSQIVNLFQDLQQRYGLTYVFIAHDLAVVKHICDRIAVMYLGRIVETAPTAELFARPLHPYTQALLSAIPVPDPDAAKERILLAGDVPNPVDLPPGCRFQTRCRHKLPVCAEIDPELVDAGGGHCLACHLQSDWR